MSARLSHQQGGAALIIVLLLIATLSFIVLAVGETMTYAAHRSLNARVRSEAMWRAIGVETLAISALSEAAKESPGVMTLDEPWVERPIEAPMEGGGATIVFMDATRCVNLNSLTRSSEGGGFGEQPPSAQTLVATLEAAGATTGDAESVAAVVIDWIDADSVESQRGAEDSYYTALPTPYRTGGAPLADETELLAMAEVNPDLYRAARHFVCALPNSEPAPVNVNMLRPDDAPVLVGMLRGAISTGAARDVIAARPPGGFASIEAFWASPAFAGKTIPPAVLEQAQLDSRYIEARAKITFEGAIINAVLIFELNDAGEARLVSRRWGTAE